MNLINKDYQQQLENMHENGKFANGTKQYKLVRKFLDEYRPTTVLDFGCGKGGLIAELKKEHPEIKCWGYDPGNPVYSNMPLRTFDAVISTDAIEHIEPEYLDETLRLLASKIERCAFLRIACHPAKKRLPDGRNAHLIVEEPAWWRDRILSVMPVSMAWERIEEFDRREKNPLLFGSKYDVILTRR